jgi:hypothetical protein
MEALYKSGCSLAEVGDAFGVTAATICNLFAKHGIERRKSWEWRQVPCYRGKMIARQLGEMNE